MEEKRPNRSIVCTVTQCANHACGCNFCSLERISVGTHEKNPTVSQCTDCESFVLGVKSPENDPCSCNGKKGNC